MRRGFLLTYVGNAPERMSENFVEIKNTPARVRGAP
jgi:hypothetical protein